MNMRYWIIVALCTNIWVSGHSQLLLKEGFAYSGESLIGQGEAGDGWAGPWMLRAGTAPGQLVGDSLINPTLQIRSVLPYASLPSGQQHELERSLENSILYEDSPLWLGFLADPRALNAYTQGSLSLVDYGYGELFSERIALGKAIGALEIVADGVSEYPRSTGVFYDRAVWVVARMSAIGEDSVRLHLWVDPEPFTIPDTADADIRNRIYQAQKIDAIRLTSNGMAGLDWRIDDIYLGRSFPSIIPDDWATVEVDSLQRNAREPFDYQPGTPLEGENGGSGFALPWEKVTGFDHAIEEQEIGWEVAENRSVPPLLSLPHEANNTNCRFVRRLDYPYLDNGATYWLGMLMEVDYSTNGNVAQLFLADAGAIGPTGPAGQLLLIGKSFQQNLFTLGRQAEYQTASGNPAAGSYFAVLRIQMSGDAGPEQISLWLDPPLGVQPPATSEADITASYTLNQGWNAIGVKVEGSAGIQMKVDDIALGTSYQAVLPALLTYTKEAAGRSALRLFPNPGNGKAAISIPGTDRIDSIQVFDWQGRLLRQLRGPFYDTEELKLLPANTPTGQYLVQCFSASKRYTAIYLKSK